MNTNEIIDLIEEAIALAGDGGDDPFTTEEREEMVQFLEAQRPKEHGCNIWNPGEQPRWKVGDILAYWECSSDFEGEHCIGKIILVEFDEEYEDWFYTFENGTGDTEESLSDDECYTISEEYYNKHYKH